MGAKAAGIKPVWAFDINTSAVETVKANHYEVHAFIADVRDITQSITALTRVDMLFCGIPCQPYTRIGKRGGDTDERAISQHVSRLVLAIRPRYLVFENVREYRSSKGFSVLNEELSAVGYKVVWDVVNVADYGVPQRRSRLFGIGVRGDCTPQFPAHTHTKERSLFDQRPSWRRFKTIKDGAGMKPLSAKALRGVLRRLAAHSKKGNGFSVQVIDEKSMMMTVLGVMYRGSGTSSNSTLIWDNGTIRNVSFLEARRAQGFPDDYVICGTKKEQWQQVGNAWPPLMVTRLVDSLKFQV